MSITDYAQSPAVSRLKERLTASVRLQRIRDELEALTESADEARDEAMWMTPEGEESNYVDDIDCLLQYLSFARSEMAGIEKQIERVMI